jgi:hypothetical protein
MAAPERSRSSHLQVLSDSDPSRSDSDQREGCAASPEGSCGSPAFSDSDEREDRAYNIGVRAGGRAWPGLTPRTPPPPITHTLPPPTPCRAADRPGPMGGGAEAAGRGRGGERRRWRQGTALQQPQPQQLSDTPPTAPTFPAPCAGLAQRPPTPLPPASRRTAAAAAR